MTPRIESMVLEMRRTHPSWGPRTILNHLARKGTSPLPARTSIYRALVRHHLIDPKPRKRRASDYKRWERSRSMELWQMDVTLGVRLQDGTRPSVVTGIDDHSRFCVCARVVERATAKPVCDALLHAIKAHGVPEGILSDNGKVFTGRFGPGKGPVMFDRICREKGIRHLLTAPGSPTTTGKVERFHKTMKREFLDDKVFSDLEQAQRELDKWVKYYNLERDHQSIGDRPPIERFRLARRDPSPKEQKQIQTQKPPPEDPQKRLLRKVGSNGKINLIGFKYHVGKFYAGQTVEVTSHDGLVEVSHKGVLIATHARRHLPERDADIDPVSVAVPPRASEAGPTVVRKVDGCGSVSFAGVRYRVGNAYKCRQVEVQIVGDTVRISTEGRLLRTHQARHDRRKEHGALGNPGGRPDRINAA
jgi:transposase InsO family protein